MSKTVKEVLGKVKKRKERGSGTKKYGRNKIKCARYRAEGRLEKNKARRQKKHLKMVAKKIAKKETRGH
jgi:hypothetical protein